MNLADRIAIEERKCRGCRVNPPAFPDQAYCEACLRDVNRAYHAAPPTPIVERRAWPAKALDRSAA